MKLSLLDKIIFSLFMISLIIFFPYHSDAKDREGSKKGLPNFIFSTKDINGNKVDLAKYVGKKVILVNFWATWCPPCRFEVPELIKLQEVYKNKLQIVGISVDRGLSDVKNYKEHKFNFPIVWDYMGEISYLYGGIASIPTTFIINKEGKIVERMVGARTFEYFESVLKKYLGD